MHSIQAAASQLMKIQRKRLLDVDDLFDNNNNNNSSDNNNGKSNIIALTAPDHQGLCKRPRLTGASPSSMASTTTTTTSDGVKRHHVTHDELTQALLKVTQKNRRSAGRGGCGNGMDEGLMDDRLDPVKRAQHNVLERKRRTDLKMSFQVESSLLISPQSVFLLLFYLSFSFSFFFHMSQPYLLLNL